MSNNLEKYRIGLSGDVVKELHDMDWVDKVWYDGLPNRPLYRLLVVGKYNSRIKIDFTITIETISGVQSSTGGSSQQCGLMQCVHDGLLECERNYGSVYQWYLAEIVFLEWEVPYNG